MPQTNLLIEVKKMNDWIIITHDDTGRKWLLRKEDIDNVVEFTDSSKISFKDGTYIYVKETLDEVFAMLTKDISDSR